MFNSLKKFCAILPEKGSKWAVSANYFTATGMEPGTMVLYNLFFPQFFSFSIARKKQMFWNPCFSHKGWGKVAKWGPSFLVAAKIAKR